jgi:hypothetical protein
MELNIFMRSRNQAVSTLWHIICHLQFILLYRAYKLRNFGQLTIMVTKHNQISALASLVDPRGELIFLIKNIFTKNKILAMTTEVEWLDMFAKPSKRGVHKEGSRMVTFGIRYKYGKLAW